MKPISKSKKYKINQEQIYYDKSILDRYIRNVHIDLIKDDGLIDEELLLNKYGVRFDDKTNRILFPHYKYDDSNKIAGVIGRTVLKAHKELRVSKYMSLLDSDYVKTNNLYALSLNINYIEKNNEIIVFEAEKSVIKADMFGYPIGVSVGCHDLSDFQINLLLRLNVEIIIAFDNDVNVAHIESICKKLSPFRKVSYIKDKWGLLKGKDSPVDRGITKWKFLYKHRIRM